MRQLNKLILPLLLLSSPICTARNADTALPIEIEADSVEIREQEGISTYRGGVIISRGSMVIKGDLIVIHSNPQGIDKIVVDGQPASFRQLNEQDEEISAQSLEMTYEAETGILVLKRQAVLVQKQNKFTSEHIIYNTRQDIVQAGDRKATDSEEGTPQRVTITIQPPKENQQNKNDDAATQ